MPKLLFSILLLTTSAQAAEFCTIEPVADARVAGRANKIHFPDGRVIEIVGQHHGNRQVLSLGAEAAKVKDMTDNEFEGEIRKALDENKKPMIDFTYEFQKSMPGFAVKLHLPPDDANRIMPDVVNLNLPTVLEAARRDKSYLLYRLQNQTSERPQFIGLEAEGQSAKEYARSYVSFVAQQIRQRQSNLTLSPQEIRDFLISGTMGHLIAYISKPELEKIAPLISIEGPASEIENKGSVEDGLALTNMFLQLDSYLAQRTPKEIENLHPELLAFAKALAKNVLGVTNRYLGTSPDELADELQKVSPSWLTTSPVAIATLRKLGNQIVERDRQAAQNLVDLKVSGIHFVGGLHLGTLSHNLRNLCLEETKKSPTTSNEERPGVVRDSN